MGIDLFFSLGNVLLCKMQSDQCMKTFVRGLQMSDSQIVTGLPLF